jgi:hypothetical protein
LAFIVPPGRYMSIATCNLTPFCQRLFDCARSLGSQPASTLEYVLSGKEFEEGHWEGWGRFVPSELQENWTSLSVEMRIVAYAVACRGVDVYQDVLDC